MTTFISYSRVNSDFAVRLAQDLKSADFDVWLDQLDIPTGARWDDEIEKALEKCDTFMIILSPESIQSQNVKDEIGYAIDSGKHILPVVLKDCKVPFRLRRFQYVDFSDDTYAESLSTIKFLLGKTSELTEKITEGNQTPIGPYPPKPRPIPGRDDAAKERGGRMRSASQFLFVGAGIVVIVLVVIFGRGLLSPSGATETAATSPVPSLPSPTFTETDTAIPPSDTPITAPPTDKPIPLNVAMVTVPEGNFIMGTGNGDKDKGEMPVHVVFLKAYSIDKYEVTNKQYQECVGAGGCKPPMGINSPKSPNYYGNDQFDTFPVVNVTWEMARTYCEWRGARLPTEAEWEKAARGVDGYTYPWGKDKVDCGRANYNACGEDTSAVGATILGEGPYGAFDMAGNVWEWVADWYHKDYYSTSDASQPNPTGPDTGSEHVIRGGSCLTSSRYLYAAHRNSSVPSKADTSVGFRCVKDP